MRYLMIVLLGLGSQQALAQHSTEPDEPTAFFASYCVSNFVTPGFDIEKELNALAGAIKLTDEQEAAFLGNTKFRAWTFKTKKSQYVIAVHEKFATCELYANAGDRDRAWNDFDDLASRFFKPWNAVGLLPEVIGKDTETHKNFKSVYYHDAPESARVPAFFITTDYSSRADGAGGFAIQLKISFAERSLFDVLRKGPTGQ